MTDKEDDDIKFDASLSTSFNIQTDLLIDIYCWQQIILRRMVAQEVLKTDRSYQDIMKDWDREKFSIRSHVVEQVFVKHGPSLSQDLDL